jgi:hypothetical protein
MAGVVDRLLAQLPGLQSDRADNAGTRPRASFVGGGGAITTISTSMRAETGQGQVATWARVLLALTFGLVLARWPYGQACGLPLLGYLSAVTVLVLSAGVGAAAAWRTRSALAHVVALSLMLYGAALSLAELLPRTGYAVRHATWQCSASTDSSQWVATYRR